MANCSVESCPRKARKRGMCPKCYWAFTHPETPCSVEGCPARARSGGMCTKHYKAAWDAANPDKIRGYKSSPYYRPEAYRDRNLQHNYGISLAEFNVMAEAQCGVCAICQRPPNHVGGGRNCRVLHVDHDHTTGKVRGLLCVKCNVMLGKAEDSVVTLQKGIDYLNRTTYLKSIG